MENLIKEESKIHILDNKYNIIQNLGEGAFGTALLVQEIKTGDIYVAKILLKKMIQFLKMKYMFLNTSRIKKLIIHLLLIFIMMV